MALLLVGCAPVDVGREGQSSIVDTSDGENVLLCYDEDMTNERAVSFFLNRDKEELEFHMFCLLARDGMTIDVVVDKVSYTFTCSMKGDIISVRRTDGELFDLKEKHP